jgi:hypothetical protein
MLITERDIFLHATRSFELLKKSIETFDKYLKMKLPPKSQEYYQARNYLKEGQTYFDEILKKAKQLLGPISPYSPQEVEKQSEQVLMENKIIVRGLSLGDLSDELAKDEFLRTMMSASEIAVYAKDHFVAQASGKRKLANIKMRMIIDKLRDLSNKGEELKAAAQKYFQAG